MKLLAALVLNLFALSAGHDCTETSEISLGALGVVTKMSFTGYNPTVTRFTNTGVGNKVVLKGYTKEPSVVLTGTQLAVTAGDVCDGDHEDSGAVARSRGFLGYTVPLVLAASGHRVAAVAAAAAAGFLPTATADKAVACDSAPIEVEIYIDATINELVMLQAKSGDFEVCPPETLYWEHHPGVYDGFTGCVGEKAYYPCAQDSQGVWEEGGALYEQYPINYLEGQCVPTGYDTSNRTFWILWGDPLDKFELNKRTRLNPVVTFPFNRGPYPRYEQGVPIPEAIDDSNDGRAAAKDLLVYIGAFTATELEAFDVTFTEGAESGMVSIWAGKALEIARTTCNRDIYALMEAPAYGYNPGDSAASANMFASSFYNGTECPCQNTTMGCTAPTVTVTNVGWLPMTPLPTRMGGDGNMYAADSTSPNSPWFESMVFPENPSGKIKTPQIADPNRRVCDGVYVWPMYFGMRGYVIPMDERPDCSAWSFSITKAYSASVRAGFIMYKELPVSNHDAQVDTVSELYTMTHGLYSEWSWYGQIQLWDMIMSRSLTDPTSWIGAYSEIMEEKWAVVIDGFDGCPVVTLTNPRAGAYAWFKYNAPYLGVQEGFVSSFFRDVLGVRTTTYNWGFRGSDPADFYGPGYSTTDFTRLQLYRDVAVYVEVARRAKIVCADPDAVIGNFVSVSQWQASRTVTRERRMTEGYTNREERMRHLQQAVPSLTEKQLDYLATSHESSDLMDEQAELCAPDYTTSCLFQKVGQRFKDY